MAAHPDAISISSCGDLLGHREGFCVHAIYRGRIRRMRDENPLAHRLAVASFLMSTE